eukprot:TRINITY_DN4577_c0_g1_i1.p1 TRINITY_DN4577_c0_g1~~TRINITY_DN4577_c0_g1_i1.p1  ORF type:complete len:945 (+),score=244.56 TRINITY_DN4577_c0_g1_i1:167-3001(+)
MNQHTIQIDEEDRNQSKDERNPHNDLLKEQLKLAGNSELISSFSNLNPEFQDDLASKEIRDYISFQLPTSFNNSGGKNGEEYQTLWGFLVDTASSFVADAKRIASSLLKLSTYKEHFTSRKFIGALKAAMVILTGCFLQLYPPVSDYLGQLSLLIVIPVILFDMNASFGVAIEYCLLFVFMTVVSTVFTGFALWVSYDKPWGLAFWIAFLIGMFAWARASWKPRWTISCVIAMVLVPVIILFGRRIGSFSLFFTFQICLNTIIGCALCLFYNILLFPKSAFLDLKEELSKSAETMKKVVDLTHISFTLQSDLGDEEKKRLIAFQAQVQTHYIRLGALLEKASLEPFVSSFSFASYRSIVDRNRIMLVQLKGMITSCQLSPNLLERTPVIKEFIRSLTPCMQNLTLSLESSLDKLNEKMKDSGKISIELVEDRSANHNRLSENIFKFDDVNQSVITTVFTTATKTETWDDIFFIYFFLFTFREFARETEKMVQFLDKNGSKSRRLRMPGTLNEWNPWASFLALFQFSEKKEKKRIPKFKARVWDRIRRVLNYFVSVIDTDQFRYAVKIGITVFVATLPEWISPWNLWFSDWRGEWIAITVTLIMTPSFGTSFMASGFRIAGTIIGALWAVITFYLFGLRPWGIFIMFFIFVWPCFTFLYSGRPRAKIAGTALLTFAVIILSKYANRNNPVYYEVYRLAIYRTVMIVGGVILTLIFDRCLWPVLARSNLRKNLCLVIHDLAEFFGRNSSYIMEDTNESDLKKISSIESKARIELLRCEGLLTIAENEPHLGEPLNVAALKHVMSCLSTILERMSYQRMTIQEEWESFVTKGFVEPLHYVRKEMTAHVLMRFWVMAESIRSRTPIPQHLPDPIKVRSKLLRMFKKLPALQDSRFTQHSFTITRYYAFALASKEVIIELERLVQTIRILVGEEKEVSPDFFSISQHYS